MPSKSKAQRNLMAAAAHNPAFAKKVGVPMDVAKEFNQADKGRKFKGGGMAKSLFGGKETYSEELKEAKALKSGKISEQGFVKGEKSEGHKDEEKNPTVLAKAIKSGKKSPQQYASEEAKEMSCGGKVKKMCRGGGIEVRGKTKGKMV